MSLHQSNSQAFAPLCSINYNRVTISLRTKENPIKTVQTNVIQLGKKREWQKIVLSSGIIETI